VSKLYLVDGSSYLYRAFHALPPFTNSRGEPTGAVLGVVNMLNKFLRECEPERIAIVFDAPGRTFRDELFESYKAQRPPMPDDLRSQLEPLLETVEALGLPVLRISGVEADDVIGTLAKQSTAAGFHTVISTGDKDMAQLVDGHVALLNTMSGAVSPLPGEANRTVSGSVLDRDGVKTKFDVWPEQIVDYLALVGDTSDNIPGVPKVGPKTAAKWLAQFGTLDALIARNAEIEGKVGDSLRENLSQLELSRKLATIRCDVELPVALDGLARRAPDVDKLRAIFRRLELNSLLRALEGDAPRSAGGPVPAAGTSGVPAVGTTGDLLGGGGGTPDRTPTRPASYAGPYGTKDEDPFVPAGADPAIANAPRHYETVTTEAQLEAWLAKLAAAPLFAFDTETTSLDYMQARIVGFALATAPGEAAYVPVAHVGPEAGTQLPCDAVLAKLKPLLEDPSRIKVVQHGKYDAHVVENHGVKLDGIRYDTMLESYVLNSVATRHDMDSMAKKYLGIDTIKFEDVAGKGAKQLCFDQVPVDRAAEYSAEDADVTLRLHLTLWPQLEKEARLKALYEEVEQPLAPVLQRMERLGVLVDREQLRVQSTEMAKQMQEIELAAHAIAGSPFNLESPKQLQAILFERLQLPVTRRTPTGQPSTGEDVLEELAEAGHALPRKILDYRQLSKLKGTYTDKLPEMIDATTGRIHTSYHQAVAATGRLSSSNPNLQNIPIRTEAGRRIRRAFVAPAGHVLMAADYSQIELRIMAHLADDPGLKRAFAEDRDVHQATAAEMFGVPLEQVDGDQRRAAKTINFGLIYGMSAFGLAARLGIERGAAAKYIERYFERYAGVKRYMDETRVRAREQGYVETVDGRRLYLPDIRARNKQLQQYAERAAINAPLQGTAADIIKRAMIRVDAWLRNERAPARLVMQVHDELVFEVQEDAVQDVRARVTSLMCDAAELAVPLKVEVGTGPNWDEAH
jgi:DNA polymerase-1